MSYVPPHRRRQPQQQPQRQQQHTRNDSNKRSTPEQTDDKNLQLFREALHRICCINLKHRPERWRSVQRQARRIGIGVDLFQAVDGAAILNDGTLLPMGEIRLDWDGTKNSSYSRKAAAGPRTMVAGEVGCALSHIRLWKELAEEADESVQTMLILEDDICFVRNRGEDRFLASFANAWRQLPEGWDILYLGLSDRGERLYLDNEQNDDNAVQHHHPTRNPKVQLYRPEYGYHTHAYIITKKAAKTLLSQLPVAGPIDVWLGDNDWFGLAVYSAVVANEGWRNPDGTFEGKELITQNKREFVSDVTPAERRKGNNGYS